MPVTKLRLQPGVDLQSSPLLNQTRFARSQLIRFYEGLVQKIGGWMQFTATPAIGTCRALLGWADLAGNTYVALGTEQRLQVLVGGTMQDVTPVVATTNSPVSFSTTAGSTVVSINDSRTPSAGDWINLVTPVSVGGMILAGLYQVQAVGIAYTIIAATPATATVVNGGAAPAYSTSTASTTVSVLLAKHGLSAATSTFTINTPVVVGGLTLQGTYVVAAVVDSSHFTITAAAAASSNATAGGSNASISYLLPTGGAVNQFSSGFGSGNYGSGDYGAANATGSGVTPMRVWSLDHWGQDLVGAPNTGSIFYWQPGSSAPAAVVSSTAPLAVNWILVASEVQIMIALGAESGGTQYPLLMRWCDAADFTDWTPTVSNQAGSFQLNSGSALVTGIASGLSVYIWTDLGVWVAAYQGLPYVFGFTEIARECGAISSRSVVPTAAGIVWLSRQGFYQLSGGAVQPMECPVWDWYYANVDLTQAQAITAAANSAFHEVSWYFPTLSGGTAYVKWNWIEQAWDYGTLIRTAWIDASPAGGPMGIDGAGILQQHEIGNDANGSPIVSSVQTGYFDVQDGEEYAFCDQLFPDFIATAGATINLTVLSQDYPETIAKQDGPHAVQPLALPGTTPVRIITCNSRGRQLALEIHSSDTGSFWRLGALRYKWRPDGKL